MERRGQVRGEENGRRSIGEEEHRGGGAKGRRSKGEEQRGGGAKGRRSKGKEEQM